MTLRFYIGEVFLIAMQMVSLDDLVIILLVDIALILNQNMKFVIQ